MIAVIDYCRKFYFYELFTHFLLRCLECMIRKRSIAHTK